MYVNKKVEKIQAVIILIVFLICKINLIIYAVDYDTGEFEYASDSGSGSSSGGGDYVVNPLPDDSGNLDRTEYYHYFGSLAGNAYEQLESITSQQLGNIGTDSTTGNKGIGNILVELLNEDGTTRSTIRTGSSGEYIFNRDSFEDGLHNYKIKFTYGQVDNNTIENATIDNYKNIQNILKYNIQDYKESTESYIFNTIKSAGKSCAQVYLVLDCSNSMKDEITLEDGTKKKKIDIEKELAQKIVDSLLDGNRNVYIGLVVYTGECYRRVSLTNDKSILNQGITGEFNFNTYTYTNIKSALEKARNSFANNGIDTSNRYMFLLSDGVPTSDGNDAHKIYRNRSKQVNDENLLKIADETKETVKQILEQQINLYSVFANSDSDEQDKSLINYIFNSFDEEYSEYNKFKEIESYENISNIVKEIKDDFSKFVKDSIEITNIPNGVTEEDRAIIKEKFPSFNYDNTKIFEAIDMEVTDQESLNRFKEYAKELAQYTGGGSESEIQVNKDPIPTLPNPNPEPIKNEEGEIIGNITYVLAPDTYRGPDLILQRLPELTIRPVATITGMEVTASNGATMTISETNTIERKVLLSTIQEKFLYGSKVLLRCNLGIKNQSTYTDCDEISLICSIPDGFELEEDYTINISGIDSEGEKKLLNSMITGIEKINSENITNLTVGENYINHLEDEKELIKIDFKINPDEFILMNQGSINVSFVLSKMLSNSNENMDYTLEAEIYSYSNRTARRLQYMSDTRGLVGATLGNYNVEEFDYDESNDSIIVIPTGKKIHTIFKVVLIIIGIGLFIKIRK